jgi:hypothetical protein
MADRPDRTLDLAILDILDGADAPAGGPGAARGPSDPHLATLEDLTRLLLEEASLEQLLDQTLELTVRALRAPVSVSVTVVEDDGTYLTLARTDEDAAAADGCSTSSPRVPASTRWSRRRSATSPTCAATTGGLLLSPGEPPSSGSAACWPSPSSSTGAASARSASPSPDPDGLDAADRELARRLATPAATTLANGRAYQRVSRLAAQLEEALDSRATIERAKGILMAREGYDADVAFERLRRASQQHNRKLRDVARAVVASL